MTVLLLIMAIVFSVLLNLIVENLPYLKLGSKKKTILLIVLVFSFSVALGLVSRLINVDIPLNIAFFVTMTWIVILYAIFYKSIKIAIVSFVYIILTYFSIGAISVLLLSIIGQEELYTEYNWGIFVVISAIVMGLSSHGIKNLVKKRLDMHIFNHSIINLLAILIGVSLTFIYFTSDADVILVSFVSNNIVPENLNQLAYVLLFISIGIMFIVIIRYIFTDSILQTERLINEASKKYVQELELAYTGLRTIKHDYINIMSTLKLYLDSDDIDGLKKYYYNELETFNQSLLYQDKLMTTLQKIEIKEVKSILAYKGSLATEHDVDVYIEAHDLVNHLGISTAIACQILGILLDNAIEGAMETDEPKLRIAIIKNLKSTVFIIKNTWKQIEVGIDKFFELGFTTKGKGRGTGLDIVNTYLTKIKNLHLETEVTDSYFAQLLTIKDDSRSSPSATPSKTS